MLGYSVKSHHRKKVLFWCIFVGLMSLREGRTVGLRSWRGICEPQVVHGAHLAFLPVSETVCAWVFCLLCVGFFFFFLVGWFFYLIFFGGDFFSENASSCCHIFPGAPGTACQHVLNILPLVRFHFVLSYSWTQAPTSSLCLGLLMLSPSHLVVWNVWKSQKRGLLGVWKLMVKVLVSMGLQAHSRWQACGTRQAF